MSLKEKLELLWKYLLLAVLIFGFTQLGKPLHRMNCSHDGRGYHSKKMMWYGDKDFDLNEMEIDVEVEKLMDGDSMVKVIINGETLDLDDLEDLGGNVFVKTFKHGDDDQEKQIKVIKKKVKKN